MDAVAGEPRAEEPRYLTVGVEGNPHCLELPGCHVTEDLNRHPLPIDEPIAGGLGGLQPQVEAGERLGDVLGGDRPVQHVPHQRRRGCAQIYPAQGHETVKRRSRHAMRIGPVGKVLQLCVPGGDHRTDAEEGAVVEAGDQARQQQFITDSAGLTERLLKFDRLYIVEQGLSKEHRAFAAALYCINLRETYPGADGKTPDPESFDAVAKMAAEYYDTQTRKKG